MVYFKVNFLPPKFGVKPMFGENWRLVYCEPVPLEK
jgi:hypothetical protein